MTEQLLVDRVALVTGGGAGIGRAIARSFAAAGADIVIADIVPARCEEVAARVRELGRAALPVVTDAMATDQVPAMVEAAEKWFGRIDILVNNVGGVAKRPFLEQSERSWRRHIDLNFVSMLAATSAAVPAMIRGGRGGSIINVSSIEGERAAPNFAVYAACKAAMNSFTRSMALELSEHRIRVNSIGPDLIPTAGTMGNLRHPVDPSAPRVVPAEQEHSAKVRIPLGRPGLEEECGSVALFLASEMSSYVTGAIVPVDGGAWASSGWIRRDGKWVLG